MGLGAALFQRRQFRVHVGQGENSPNQGSRFEPLNRVPGSAGIFAGGLQFQDLAGRMPALPGFMVRAKPADNSTCGHSIFENALAELSED